VLKERRANVSSGSSTSLAAEAPADECADGSWPQCWVGHVGGRSGPHTPNVGAGSKAGRQHQQNGQPVSGR